MCPYAKRKLRDLVQRALPSNIPPILVASMGRSGSTLVHDAICRGLASARFPIFGELPAKLVKNYAWDIGVKPLRPGVAYKTHGLHTELGMQPDVKIVFVFGSPVEAVLSTINAHKTKGDEWISAHLRHLRAQSSINDITEKDVLRFSEQLNWLSLTSNPVIGIKYDALWDNQSQLSDFLGFSVSLPLRHARSFKQIEPEITRKIQSTYANLESRIMEMPDVTYSCRGS